VRDKIVVSFDAVQSIVSTVKDGHLETVTRFKAGTEIAVETERWAPDGSHTERFLDCGYPATQANSWKFGCAMAVQS
jgi:hypothetical protein